MAKDASQANISSSSVETQRALRVEKMDTLRELGHDPFPVKSHRQFSLQFVKFWFDFVHNYDLAKFQEDFPEPELQYFFLDQVFFPASLVEKLEEKLFLRQLLQNADADFASEIDEEFDESELNEVRRYFPSLFKISEKRREELLADFFGSWENFDPDSDERPTAILQPRQKVTLVGRMKSKRVSGKIAFATVEDESLPEGFQFIFKRDLLEEEDPDKDSELEILQDWQKSLPSLSFEEFKTLLDEGDYIQATGYLEQSQRGEPSLFVTSFRLLTKSLRPLPEKLDYENVEERYTNRVVDFKMNTTDPNGLSVREIVRLKQKYWSIWREEMQRENFLEVECPIFEHIPGGAEAKPFTTFYNELDQEVFLRISLELPLKKLIAGGFEKVFEIGRIFRNEGSSPQHLQEYTQIEWYWAYADYTDGMKLVKRVYQRIVQEVLGQMAQIDYYGHPVNWGEWCSLAEARKHGWGLATTDQVWEPTTMTLKRAYIVEKSLPANKFQKLSDFGTVRVDKKDEAWGQIVQLFYTDEAKVLNFLSENLISSSDEETVWYAEVGSKVVFPDKIIDLFERGGLEKFQVYGRSLGVPEEQLDAISASKIVEDISYSGLEEPNVFGWPIIPYYEAVRYYSGGRVDFEGKTYEELLEIAKEYGVDVEPGTGLAGVMDKIYKKVARPHIHNPIFLALVPVELEPLAKRNPQQPHLTERWQVVAGTAELGKCFSELNDPVDQFGRFEEQQAARDAGDEEAQFMDQDYVKALELGTPPMAGFGTSERFLSFLLGKHIKECVTFPHVRKEENDTSKSKRTMVAHAVILDTPNVPLWSKMNAAAHLSASFAAREGKKLIHLDKSDTKDGTVIPMNIQHAIVMKKTDSVKKLRELKAIAEEKDLTVSVFTKEMRDSSNDDKVTLEHSKKKDEEIGYLGVLVFGKKSDVERLTEEFEKV